MKSTLFKLSSILLLLFATSARAYTDLYLDSFTTSNWNASSGWQSCAAYSGGRPCISNGSYFSGDGIGSGDVVFAYTTNNISDTFSITSTMRSSTGSNYVAIDMMTGPRNSEQGNKTEYVGITIIKYSSVGSQIQSYSFSENITNTSMETFAYDIGSLANTYNIGIIISGRDGGYWAGNYGAVIGSGSLYVTDTDPTAPAAPTYSSSISSAQTQDITDSRNVTHSGNGIYIQQSGIGVDINILQEGNDNLIAGSSTTSQITSNALVSGDYNTLNIEQKSDNNVLLFGVNGNHNTLSVSQGNYNGDIGGHRAIVNITGNYNSPSLLQYNTGFGSGQFADLNISGNDNTINSAQRETDKVLFVDVNGDDNIVSTNQKDSGQHFLDITLSSDQTVSVTQEGIGDHSATIDLSGYSSTLQLNQNSSTDQTYSINQNCLTVTGCGTTTITQQ
jgi:hypothetical protein